MLDAQTIRLRVDEMIAGLSHRVSVNDRQFALRVYADGIDKYRDRMRQYGFSGLHRVLDAGCGFGQWALAMSLDNDEVAAVDASAARVDGLNALARGLGVRNLSARVAVLEQLPFPDGEFDGIFCYGVIFLSRWKESLAELARVLRPGGRLYVNANGIGWYKHLWYTQHNRTVDYDPQQVVAQAFRNTLDYRRQRPTVPGHDIIIEPDELTAEMERLGLGSIVRAAEGRIGLADGASPRTSPFFQESYLGDLGVYELMARKAGR